MPKNDINYADTIFYKIVCKDPSVTDLYIGHTTNFVQRKHTHKQTCNNIKSVGYNLKLYKTIRANGNWSNWEMIIINSYNCKDNIEAKQKELEQISVFGATLNFVETQQQQKPNQKPNQKNDQPNTFMCKYCDYYTSKKSNIDKHLLTVKHKKATLATLEASKGSDDSNKNKIIFKKCEFNENILLPNDNTQLLLEVIKKDCELKDFLMEQNKQLTEQNKQLIELLQTNKPSNTTNNVNTTNNNFNLQFYLNDTCKDAVSLVDFVDSLQVKLQDLEETARLGYTEGVSRIIINGLNELDVCKRPIHCSDLKRETLYIKDQDEWTKEDSDKTHLSKAIKDVSKKNVQQIFEWQKKYPEYKDPDSRQSDRYMEMICNTMNASSKEEQDKNMNKIIKNITKEVVIDKNI
jgi:hypothetical protein